MLQDPLYKLPGANGMSLYVPSYWKYSENVPTVTNNFLCILFVK